MNDIVLIGGGGHCKSIIDVIEQGGVFNIVGIVDKSQPLNTSVLGYSVIGNDSDLIDLAKKYHYALVTVGQIKSPLTRIKLFNLARESGFKLPSIVSSRAYVSKNAVLGSGTVVMHDALVNVNVVIGDNCIINSKALIEHDSIIESNCHISTNATINGNVIVGEGSFIGSGATTKESIVIAKNSLINANSFVI
jgi:sugar O-acyltransferase (sialic acid O-acetyltransferase NeuD family)